MIDCKKVFVDSAPLIYFFDADLNYGQKTLQVFSEVLNSGKELVLSSITCMEYLVYPYRTQNIEKINAFYEFVNDCNVSICNVDLKVATEAAKIRAEYKTFHAMDALQIASTCVNNCDVFLTNDKQLCQFSNSNLRCILIDECQ